MKRAAIYIIISLSMISCAESQVKNTQKSTTNDDFLTFQYADGGSIKINRKNHDFFSMIYPTHLTNKKITIENGSYYIPIINEDNFVMLMGVGIYEKPENINFKQYVFNETISSNSNKNSESSIRWSEKTFYKVSKDEMTLTNSKEIYILSGISESTYPVKSYIIGTFLLSPDSKNIIEITGILLINPESKLYNNWDEVKRYLIDLKIYSLTTKFI